MKSEECFPLVPSDVQAALNRMQDRVRDAVLAGDFDSLRTPESDATVARILAPAAELRPFGRDDRE